jgi:hypothetical protein
VIVLVKVLTRQSLLIPLYFVVSLATQVSFMETVINVGLRHHPGLTF